MPFVQYQMWMIMDNQPDFWRPLLSGKQFQKMISIQGKKKIRIVFRSQIH